MLVSCKRHLRDKLAAREATAAQPESHHHVRDEKEYVAKLRKYFKKLRETRPQAALSWLEDALGELTPAEQVRCAGPAASGVGS